jgi:hypothetical protein
MALNETSELPESLRQSSLPLACRINFYREADANLIRATHCGVAFIMSFWSPYSRRVYPQFIEGVAKADPDGRLEILVVDNDGVSAWRDIRKLDEIDGGWGEALWIKDGTIVLTSGSGLHPESYEPNTRRLLEMCNALPS